MLKAVSFDFWDTIAEDESDEIERKARGLPCKRDSRLNLLQTELNKYYPEIKRAEILKAYQHAEKKFAEHWRDHHHTLSVSERLRDLYQYLDLDLTPDFCNLVKEMESMELHIPPRLVPGIETALKKLASSYRLCIISDTVYSPGWALKALLDQWGFKKYFHGFVFSDELGACKPDERVFKKAAEVLSLSLSQMVHIGDREVNDVEGPQRVGMRAILYAGVKDRNSSTCRNYDELPAMIDQISKKGNS